MLKIIIWDENAIRIQEINKHLIEALKIVGQKAKITLNSEPPLLARMQLTGRTPVIEIGSNYWECGKNPADITTKQFVILLNKIETWA